MKAWAISLLPTAFYIDMPSQDALANLIVYDMAGKVVYRRSLPSSHTQRIAFDHVFAKGSYVIEINKQSKIFRARIVIQ